MGTYGKFGDGILVNARIIDNITGSVVSTARTVIDVNSCDVYENCTKKPIVKEIKLRAKRTISISDAGCAYVECPTNCPNEECGYDAPIVKDIKKKLCK